MIYCVELEYIYFRAHHSFLHAHRLIETKVHCVVKYCYVCDIYNKNLISL